jgi:hypothetical protein
MPVMPNSGAGPCTSPDCPDFRSGTQHGHFVVQVPDLEVTRRAALGAARIVLDALDAKEA